jgi:biotin transport system substrate-specific component
MNWAITGNIRRLRRKSFIGQLVLLALGVELLIFASFTTLQLPTPTQHNIERLINLSVQQMLVYLPPNSQQAVLDQFPVLRQHVPPIRVSAYVPLCPTAIFLGYVLGAPLGFSAALGFVILGMLGPRLGLLVFAGGGGLAYYKQPSFGYLLGLIPGAWFAGRITAPCNTSLRQLMAIAGGLLNIHLLGLLFLVGGSLMLLIFDGAGTYLNWQPWLFETIRNFSWYSLPYDALFSLALIGFGFPFRWLNGILTAPDIGVKPKPRWDRQLEHVS